MPKMIVELTSPRTNGLEDIKELLGLPTMNNPNPVLTPGAPNWHINIRDINVHVISSEEE